jgi:hypothetical protein
MMIQLPRALQPTAKSLLNMTKKSSILHALLFAGLAASASAALLENPPLSTGPKSIDPKGVISPDLVPANVTTKEELIALPKFRTIQTFQKEGQVFEPKQNFITFSAESEMPAVELTFEGAGATPESGATVDNANFASSGQSAVRLESTGNSAAKVKVITATLKFGDYNTGTHSFTPATPNSTKAPRAVCFTLTSQGNRSHMFQSIVAVFKDASENVLDTQSLNDLNIPNDATVRAAFFGYKSPGERIATVEITATTKDMTFSATPLLGLDDLGFVR